MYIIARKMEEWARVLATVAPVLSGDAVDWKGKSILSVSQFNESSLKLLVNVTACAMASDATGVQHCLKGHVLSCLFSEPSTRTSCSFQAGFQRLGGSVIVSCEDGSSSAKGESLEDTVRCLACYSNALIVRHSSPGAAIRAAAAVPEIPVINAGDGMGEHPTQALLDFYTIIHEMSPRSCNDMSELRVILTRKKVLLLGDLKHGRTVHSLAKLLGLFEVSLFVFERV